MHNTIRFEANSGLVACLGIVAVTIAGCISIGLHEKTKKDIRIKELELDLRQRHAEMKSK